MTYSTKVDGGSPDCLDLTPDRGSKYRQLWFERPFEIRPLAPRENDPIDQIPGGDEIKRETAAEVPVAHTLNQEYSDQIREDPEDGVKSGYTKRNSSFTSYYDTKLEPNPEVTGWAMESCAQGPFHNSSMYVGNAILLFAITEAKQNGTGLVYGFRPTSLLTLASTLMGIIVAIVCPVVGAVVDHTPYRRCIAVTTAVCLMVLTLIEVAILDPSRWFYVLLLYIIGGLFLHIHIAALLAYLPDLTKFERNINHYTARFHISRNINTVLYYLIVTAVTMPLARGPLFTSRFALGLALAIMIPLLSYSWAFLFRSRPALLPVPDGDSLLTTGFKKNVKTLVKTWTHYPVLRCFMISLLTSPDAGSGTYLSIAVTFLTTTVQMTGSEIGLVSCLMVLFGIPGSMFSKWICYRWNPLLSFRLSMIFFAFSLVCTGMLLTGPDRKNLSYLIAVLWGLSFGWFTPTQRILYCTLTPRGQEMEYMGFFTFCEMIIGWLPSLIYTIMNEAGIDQRYTMSFCAVYPLITMIALIGTGKYDTAVNQAGSFVRDNKRSSSQQESTLFSKSEQNLGEDASSESNLLADRPTKVIGSSDNASDDFTLDEHPVKQNK